MFNSPERTQNAYSDIQIKLSTMGWNGSIKGFLSTDYVLKNKVREHLIKEAVQIKPEWP